MLRDAYCRTVGIEYMHIQDPEQRSWFQDRLERPYSKPTHDEQLRILTKLNESEAFEFTGAYISVSFGSSGDGRRSGESPRFGAV